MQSNLAELKVVEDVLLRERNFGVLEGRPGTEYDAIAKEQGVTRLKAVIVDAETTSQVRSRCRTFCEHLETKIQNLIATKHSALPSTKDCPENTDLYSNDVSSSPDNISILIVTHGGWIRQCLYHFRSLSSHASVMDIPDGVEVKNCGITELEIPLVYHQGKWSFDSSSVNIVKVDDHCHIVEL